MEIKPHTIKVKDLFEGYKDSGIDGIVAYGGKLDVRPKYQRNFVYKDKQRDAVIDSVIKGFPLNVMYWVKKDDGTFEVMDGQQRTISICQYLNHDFSIKDSDGKVRYIDNWEEDVQQLIYNYELTVYFCEGSDTEKLEWFKIINIAGEQLSNQEMRNAVYSGEWVTNAKRYFGQKICPGTHLGDKYVSCDVNRQGLLELALDWISLEKGITIETYMARHQHDNDASELWDFFREVIYWVESTFPHYRKEMKRVPWGMLHHVYKDHHYDTAALEAEVDELMKDDDVTSNSGIYSYVLTRQEKYLNLRQFDDRDRRRAYSKQNGVCPICGKTYRIEEMEADHIIPWSKGGHTTIENCQMLCISCNREKGNK